MITLGLIGLAVLAVWAWVGYRFLLNQAMKRYDASRMPVVWGLPGRRPGDWRSNR